MKRTFRRDQRVNDLLQTALATILQREAGDVLPSVTTMVTVTGVSVTHDLAHAKVFVSVLDEEQASEAISALNHAAKTLRHRLASAVLLRIVPELRFVFDDSTVRGHRIASLVRDVPPQKS